MILQKQKPNKALNKAYLKEKVSRNDIETFKANLKILLSKIKEGESEEHHKYPVADFLNDTWYKDANYINTKDRADFVIHNGKTAKDTAGVILEVKSPTNASEMTTAEKPNRKAMQELVLYYLRERVEHNNIDVKHLVITNINEWYIFDEVWFEKNIFRNTRLKKDYENYKLSGKDTKFFYDSVARPALDDITEPLTCAYFNIRDYERIANNADKTDDNKLIPLYKLLSPTHLLKQPFANDSNTLDTRFYGELLHIIGLEEVKDGGKKLIRRKAAPDSASLMESAIMKLEDKDSLRNITGLSAYGNDRQEQLFNVALELCITWINRILFIKLLEGQLVTYNKGNTDFRFMNPKVVFDYDELNNLFFQVLAERPAHRRAHVKDKFRYVPYLNSSLFERTTLEREAIEIDVLDNRSELPIYSSTVLKNDQGKRQAGTLTTLHYLFHFLDAYDFSSDGGEEIQEENKNLINAAVLGLIFEKINGYKDGSFFTPGFITMYMCRETIRRAVLQKFKDAKGWECENLDQLYERIDVKDKTEANIIINSLRICDPAVGSGHFLVSALNELIAIKSELKILQDRQHKTLRDYHVDVVNDELVVTDEDGNLLDYNPHNKESQRIQEALFHEKETLIESCLFGVDINPNSVKICRLRLWIELLKNTYYTSGSGFTELETLPNIDINIKCGNSLISRFPLDADLGQALKKSKWNIDSYRIAVQTYRNAETKEEKRDMERLIDDIKGNFRTEIGDNDPKKKKLQKLNTEYYHKYQADTLFDAKLTQEQKKHKEKLESEIGILSADIKEIKTNKIYENAFEWRFEFPEVLDSDGKFVGFDLILGNPPYVRQEEVKQLSSYFETTFQCFSGKADLYVYFYEHSLNLLSINGYLSLITSGKFFEASYGKPLVQHLFSNSKVSTIINFNDQQVFEGISAYPLILQCKKQTKEDFSFKYYTLSELPENGLAILLQKYNPLTLSKTQFITNDFKFVNDAVSSLINKTKSDTISLYEFCGLPIVGVKSGYNEGFLTENAQSEYVRPLVFGRDIKKYQKITTKNNIIFPYDSNFQLININDEPILLSELNKHKEKLSNRAVIKDGIKNGTKKWYEYQQLNKTVNYSSECIVYPNVSFGNNFTFSKNAIVDITGFVLQSNSKYLLAILNSKLVEFLMRIFSISRRGGYLEYKVQYISKIPIKNIAESEQLPFISLVEKILKIKEASPQTDSTMLENEIDQLVYQLYGLTEEEVKIVEGAS